MKYTGNNLNYTFTPTSKSVDFTGEPNFAWTNLFAIINLTANAAIYTVGISGYGASIDSSGKILTLEADTTAMTASDKLMFIQDEGNDNLAQLLAVAQGISTSAAAAGVVTHSDRQEYLLRAILTEQRLTNTLLAQIGNVRDDLDKLRADITISGL